MATINTKAKTTSKKSATPQSTGMGMLALFRDLWMTFQHKDNLAPRKGGAEYEGMYEVMRSTSFIRPTTAMEALAQAVFLHCEADNFDENSTPSKEELYELSERMGRRAAGLAAWIERTHGLDRREFKLDDFCDSRLASKLFPDAPLKYPRSRSAPKDSADVVLAQAAE
ncbi:hypothetical protein [Bradyrhizobium genosp. P]|uniref:hypothetical protein n=1 Tax=Bradyrhizobium genosp. P TaxID=83641 RepID=UPI003CEE3644